MIFAAFLLPPGLMCLLLVLGRYEEWILRQPTPTQSARHARRKRHLSLVPGSDSPAHRAEKPASERGGDNTSDQRRNLDAA